MSTNPFSDPYQSPQYATPPPTAPAGRPAVMTWYIVYCVAMALLYLLCTVFGVVLLAAADKLADGEDTEAIYVQGVILLVIGGALLLLYGIAPFLPRRKFAWIYGFITIGIGLTSLCTLPFCIPLLIFWVKPETKAYLNAQ
jgi:hypothetical protein